jgi:hypothetical protein
MRRLTILCGLVLVACVPGGRGAPVKGPYVKSKETVEAHGVWTHVETFKAGERASVVAIGSGATYMGLYVYDEHSNCVAWDDLGNNRTLDDMAVQWFPPKTAPYTIEVRNFGDRPNGFSMAIR